MVGALLAIAAGGAASTLGYASMAPKSQLLGRTFVRGNPGSRQLALTFDDGPSEEHTLVLLEALDRLGVKATFFMIGSHVRRLPRIAAEVAQAGHVIGNHTFTHPNLIFRPAAQIREELARCRQALTEAVGEHSSLFRPPFGARRPEVLRRAREAGLQTVMWSITAYDWTARSSGQIEAKVMRQARGGEVVLMHDGGHDSPRADRSSTVAAVRRVIGRCRDQGFSFVTIPEMMFCPGPP
jgi:peptidoglycan/xylan/chitin deacetylase (PgdA/CDA1 family)